MMLYRFSLLFHFFFPFHFIKPSICPRISTDFYHKTNIIIFCLNFKHRYNVSISKPTVDGCDQEEERKEILSVFENWRSRYGETKWYRCVFGSFLWHWMDLMWTTGLRTIWLYFWLAIKLSLTVSDSTKCDSF